MRLKGRGYFAECYQKATEFRRHKARQFCIHKTVILPLVLAEVSLVQLVSIQSCSPVCIQLFTASELWFIM